MSVTSKRQKVSFNDQRDKVAFSNSYDRDSGSEADDDEFSDNSGASDSAGSDGSPDTDDEIAAGKGQRKSKQTLKRKRRATDSTRFGVTLQNLLDTGAPSTAPLSLKPSIARKHNDEKLELKAKKVLQVEKKEKEETGRVTDVIGGWGAEGERALRKVAQRGVVKLFNAIQQSQSSAAAAAKDTSSKGSGKAKLPAPSAESAQQKSKGKDNLLGRGKQTNVNKDDFFDLLRSGGVVSKA